MYLELDKTISELRQDVSLDTYVAGQFGINYNIGVLIRDRDNPLVKWNYMGSTEPGVPFIMLYNPGQNHYESIRRISGNKYIFDRTEIEKWENDKPKTEWELSCSVGNGSSLNKVNVGNIVTDGKDNFYVVVSMGRGPSGCQYIYTMKTNFSDQQQLVGFSKEIERRIASGQSFIDPSLSKLPPIYNIVDSSKNYELVT
jgi:hypothetical protein